MVCACAKCDINFASIFDYQKHICGKEQSKIVCRQCFGSCNDPNKCEVESCELRFRETGSYRKSKMTREEALNIVDACGSNGAEIFRVLERLALLKFDEEKKVKIVFELNNERIDLPNGYIIGVSQTYGTIRLEEWPEGLVLWVGGEIKWKSWELDRTKELVKKLAGEVKIKVHRYDHNVDVATGRIIS